MSSVFTLKHVVNTSEIDDLNHVNNVVYIQWMDTIASEHWAELTKNHPLQEYVWVVTRHEIDYKKQAVLNDEVLMKTWVGETAGFTSIRHIEFFKGDALLAKAKTTWCLLDAKTFKPTRIRENVLKVLQPSK